MSCNDAAVELISSGTLEIESLSPPSLAAAQPTIATTTPMAATLPTNRTTRGRGASVDSMFQAGLVSDEVSPPASS